MKKKMKCFDDASGSFASLTCSLISIKFKYLVCWWWFYVNLWIKAFWEIIFALKCIQVCFLLTFKNINQERNFLVTRIRWHIGHLRLFLCWSKITFEFLSAVRKNLFFSHHLLWFKWNIKSLCSPISPWTWIFMNLMSWIFYLSFLLLNAFCVFTKFLFHMLFFWMRVSWNRREKRRKKVKLSVSFRRPSLVIASMFSH